MNKKICVDIKGDNHKIAIDKLQFRPSVYGILIEDNKILLLKQWDGYDFPGGGIEIDETIEQALEREFWEETGIKVKQDKLITCETSFFLTPKGKALNSILIYYTVKKISGEISINNIAKSEQEYIGIPEWINLEKIEQLKYYNSIDSIKIIKKAVNL